MRVTRVYIPAKLKAKPDSTSINFGCGKKKLVRISVETTRLTYLMQERLLVQKNRIVKKERQLGRYIALSLLNCTEQETIPLKLKKYYPC